MSVITSALLQVCSCCAAAPLEPCHSPAGASHTWTHLERNR